MAATYSLWGKLYGYSFNGLPYCLELLIFLPAKTKSINQPEVKAIRFYQ